MAVCERCAVWEVPYIVQLNAKQEVYFEEDFKETYTESHAEFNLEVSEEELEEAYQKAYQKHFENIFQRYILRVAILYLEHRWDKNLVVTEFRLNESQIAELKRLNLLDEGFELPAQVENDDEESADRKIKKLQADKLFEMMRIKKAEGEEREKLIDTIILQTKASMTDEEISHVLKLVDEAP